MNQKDEFVVVADPFLFLEGDEILLEIRLFENEEWEKNNKYFVFDGIFRGNLFWSYEWILRGRGIDAYNLFSIQKQYSSNLPSDSKYHDKSIF